MKTVKITMLNDISDVDLEKELPINIQFKDMKVFGAIALFFGASFVGIPIVYLIKVIIKNEKLTDVLPLIPMVIIFLPVLLLGLNLLVKKKEITIYRDRIAKKYRTLFKKENWETLIADFRGLLFRTTSMSTSQRSSSLAYQLELVHADKKKTIPLYKKMPYELVHEKWKAYCRVFNIEPLESIAKNLIIKRKMEDIDRDLVDLVKEKRVDFSPNPGLMPEKIQQEITPQGEEILVLPDKTTLRIGESSVAIKRKGLFRGEMTFQYNNIAALHVDVRRQGNKWDWALVIIEKGERSFLSRCLVGHGLAEEILHWLFHYLFLKVLPPCLPKA